MPLNTTGYVKMSNLSQKCYKKHFLMVDNDVLINLDT